MSELEDIKLKALLQQMKLEKPGPNFSAMVMNSIFEESNALEQIKAQRILGKGFWIILMLFVLLTLVVYAMSNAGVQTDGKLEQLVPGMENGIQSFINSMGTVPLSVAGILIASSVLLFIDRVISANTKLFTR
ncbi:hypothetical protein [Maribellus sp. YY47]|uniref:hypothetical protein n=1 Tax=Maribellus sp. YY47 TaxID=2929486 RepID=UPI002000E97A|nr:hypothetical protein [Maribellus sp. YY47]MCK3682944.1 hypothetical protein [Maribellus sp. YY47]